MLKFLYMHGPSILGFYEGLPADEICSRLTNVNKEIWTMVPHACDALIAKKVYAIEIMAMYIIAPCLAVKFLSFVLSHTKRLVAFHTMRKDSRRLVGPAGLPLEGLHVVR
jgi:hypothetical protein